MKSQIDVYGEIQEMLERRHEVVSEIEREVDALKNQKHLRYDKVLCAAWKETQKQLGRAEGALYLFVDLLEQRADENVEKLDEADAW